MTFIDDRRLNDLLSDGSLPTGRSLLQGILDKGERLEGLSLEETALLLRAGGEADEALFATAARIKTAIYGDRLVFFSPLYLSSHCVNECDYCGFHASNEAPRKRLAPDEITEQVSRLIDMGHKRLLLEAGEDPSGSGIDYICDAIDRVYAVRRPGGEIRRVNINIAATSADNYRRLKERGIGTYQLFQETYHRPTYERLHRGPKADYERQLYAMDKAFEGGIDDVGLGVLFGLYDWRFEVLALVAHAAYLQKRFGVGPHTLSVPRFRPAPTVRLLPAAPVSDEDFLRIIAILRIAVPYTGMIISTRERPDIRARAFRLGITQTSAASCTSPGGIGKEGAGEAAQFELADRRTLDEIAVSVMRQGMTPSFCTACYRKERTGEAFMALAMPGEIQTFCRPNSLLTLMEYVEDHASPEGRQLGLERVKAELEEMKDLPLRRKTEERLERIRRGERDLYF